MIRSYFYTSEYTNWEGGVDNPPFGCLSTGCTLDYGVVARPDAGMQWNADDKSNTLPYICISKCKQGYIWHQGNVVKVLIIIIRLLNYSYNGKELSFTH